MRSMPATLPGRRSTSSGSGAWPRSAFPQGFNFAAITQLRAEAREKLVRVQPRSLAQAGRISGITPADLALVMVHLQ